MPVANASYFVVSIANSIHLQLASLGLRLSGQFGLLDGDNDAFAVSAVSLKRF